MATMYPKELPGYIRNNPLRAAECKVYDEFESQLDDTFHIFYSSPWLGTTETGEEKDGEADFTIAHVDLGMLVVEVKGGRVWVENDTREWHSVDRNGLDHSIKNPVSQARSGKHNLIKALKHRPEWNSRYINARHGVILCDTEKPGQPLAPDMPLKIFAFSSEMPRLDAWVLSRFGCRDDEDRPGSIRPLGLPGVRALRAMLSDGIQLSVNLRAYLDSDIKKIEVLTEEQYAILEELEDNQRMAVAGAAGTGKTVLAAHKAYIEAAKKGPTLLVCFNEPLALNLRNSLSGVSNLEVFSYHRLCEAIVSEAEIALPPPADRTPDYYEQTLPELFVSALARNPKRRYAAIVVDEGQDFDDPWLSSLELALADGPDTVFYVFFDNNQQVMSRSGDYIRTMQAARRRLRRNFRNTQKIFATASRFYSGDSVVPIGPPGEAIAGIEVTNESAGLTRLREKLGDLITSTGIRPERIAVLTGSRDEARDLSSGGHIGRYPTTNAANPKSGSVIVESVRRFKGLEADVVMLFLPESYIDDVEMLYVASTRAKGLLFVIGCEVAFPVFGIQ